MSRCSIADSIADPLRQKLSCESDVASIQEEECSPGDGGSVGFLAASRGAFSVRESDVSVRVNGS
jgi:hypothetical protein